MTVAWLSSTALGEIVAESRRIDPNETGGVLLGYWTSSEDSPVITHSIGPGPNAIHRPVRFIPDAKYHQIQVTEHFSGTNQLETYLGDWHSHPRGGPSLSWLDRITLARIALDPRARVPKPIMAICWGPPWRIHIWRVKFSGFARVSLPLRFHSLVIRVYNTDE